MPTIGLVQELIRKGCEVTYLMPFDWQEKIAESGAAFHGYENHRKLSEQMKNAYKAADDGVSVLSDERYKKNLEEIQKLIREAPGNRGGAERIIEYSTVFRHKTEMHAKESDIQ